MTPETPESYSFVMQRYDRDTGRLSPRIRYCAANVNLQSFKEQSLRPGALEGELAHTLFFPVVEMAREPGIRSAMERAKILGWFEVTSEWTALVNGENEPEQDPISTPPEVQQASEEREKAEAAILAAAAEAEPPAKPPKWTEDSLAGLAYRDLQKLARKLGIGGKGSRIDLQDAVLKLQGD